MTLREIYNTGTEKLSAAGIEEASLDAWYLLEYVTGISRARFLADSGMAVADEDRERYLELIERRGKRIPLQHITGVQEFMGLEFKVNEHVLIPRQDTEILVETALEEMGKRLRLYKIQSINLQAGESTVSEAVLRVTDRCSEDENKSKNISILDMCTGSGCILLSTLYYANEMAAKYGLVTDLGLRNTERERNSTYEGGRNPVDSPTDETKTVEMQTRRGIAIKGLGVDISRNALSVAKQNGENLCIEADWLESDLFSRVKGSFDMILSNPPYIPSAVIETLQPEVREHDPRLALDGKKDGLHFYRRIAEEARQYLNPGGHLIFEIGSDQGEAVSSYMKECGYTQVSVKKDLAGLDRVVSGVYDIGAVNSMSHAVGYRK